MKIPEGIKFTLTVVICVLFMLGLFTIINYVDNNGVRVKTNNVINFEKPKNIEFPIEVSSFIEYKGDYIISKDTIVEFCEVKKVKKEMKSDMKQIWKEMKNGCDN